MKKKLVAVLLLAFVGSAAAFPVSLNVVDRSATSDDPARFEVEVTNSFNEAKNFGITVSSPRSSWFFVENSRRLEPGEKHSFQVTATPPENAVQSNFAFTLEVSTGTGETESIEDYFSVTSEHDLKIVSFSQQENSYRPGETVSYTVEVLNLAAAPVEDYSLVASLGNRSFERRGVELASGGKASLELSFPLNGNEPPGSKNVSITVSRGGMEGDRIADSIQVEEVVEVEKSSANRQRLLFSRKTLEATVTGNAGANVTLNDTIPSYLDPITVFSERPARVEDLEGEKRYYWNRGIKPGETYAVSYTVNYWMPVAALVALSSGLLALKRLRGNVSFTKTAEATEEGVKVHIELENPSGKTLRDVEVTDFVPDVASVEKNFPMATPAVRSTGDGTRLTWQVEKLEPGDQRVFEYTITPLIEVEGQVNLPGAELEAEKSRVAETGGVETVFKPRET